MDIEDLFLYLYSFIHIVDVNMSGLHDQVTKLNEEKRHKINLKGTAQKSKSDFEMSQEEFFPRGLS